MNANPFAIKVIYDPYPNQEEPDLLSEKTTPSFEDGNVPLIYGKTFVRIKSAGENGLKIDNPVRKWAIEGGKRGLYLGEIAFAHNGTVTKAHEVLFSQNGEVDGFSTFEIEPLITIVPNDRTPMENLLIEIQREKRWEDARPTHLVLVR